MTIYEKISVVLSSLALFVAITGTIISNLRIRYTKPKIGKVRCYCELCDDGSLHFAMLVQNDCYHDFSIRRIELFSPTSNQRLTATKLINTSNGYFYTDAVNFFLPSFHSPVLDVWFTPEDANSILNHPATITFYLPYRAKKRIHFVVVENMSEHLRKV